MAPSFMQGGTGFWEMQTTSPDEMEGGGRKLEICPKRASISGVFEGIWMIRNCKS